MAAYPEPTHGFHTEQFCPTLETVDRESMIRAIHAAYCQLDALDRAIKQCDADSDIPANLGHYDQQPALRRLYACLKMAGHPGFREEES